MMRPIFTMQTDVNEIIARYYDGDLTAHEALLFISYIINHEEVDDDKS